MIRGRVQGFTLIELLAGIAIFALISTSLYGALGISVRAFDSAGRRTQSEQRMRVVSGYLQRAVEQSYPLALVDRGGWNLLFEGEPGRLRYVANLPGFLGYGGLYEIIFRTTRVNGRQRLLMERRPLFIDRVSGEPRGKLEQQVLLDDLQSLRLRYYGSREVGEQARWRDEWHAARRLPSLVVIQITEADGESWPPLVAQPRVTNVRFQMAAGTLGNPALGSAPPAESAVIGRALN